MSGPAAFLRPRDALTCAALASRPTTVSSEARILSQCSCQVTSNSPPCAHLSFLPSHLSCLSYVKCLAAPFKKLRQFAGIAGPGSSCCKRLAAGTAGEQGLHTLVFTKEHCTRRLLKMSMRVSYTSGLSLKLVQVYGAAVYIELHGYRMQALLAFVMCTVPANQGRTVVIFPPYNKSPTPNKRPLPKCTIIYQR